MKHPAPLRKKLIRKVTETVRAHDLFRKKFRILLAFSGGPDSTALFHILLSFKDAFGLSLGCAHVNYHLRGADSDRDEKLVRKYCKEHQIPFFLLSLHGMEKENEEGLRNLRYQFFEDTRKKHEFDVVATAHTKDDQAETILMRILRGTGPEGLSGIPFRRDSIIRPFLTITKGELLGFLSSENLPFRNDCTNTDQRILRNRVRHELIPLLEDRYQKNIVDTLFRTSQIFSEQRDTRQKEVFPTLSANKNSLSFSRKAFLELKKSEQSEALRALSMKMTRAKIPPDSAFVREVKKCIESTKSKVRTFSSKQLKIEVRGDTVIMLRP